MRDVSELFANLERIQALSEVVIVWCLKGAVILLLAAAASWFLRRSSARTRHLAWAAAILAVAGLPAIQGALPGLSVHVLLPRGVVESPASEEPATLVLEPTPRPSHDADACPDSAAAGVSGGTGIPPVSLEQAVEPVLVSAATGARSPSTANPGLPLGTSLAVLWLLGAISVFARSLPAWIRRRRLEAASNPAAPELQSFLDRLQADLGIRRQVRLLVSSAPLMPMTWGTLSPVVLLPASAGDWPQSRLRHVLLHELAHVARQDALLFQVTRLLCAFRWFDPLTWYAAHRLRVEAEHACDEHVLAMDSRPALYAGHLLESLRDARENRPLAAIALARHSQLSDRIEAILASSRRRPPTVRGILLTVLAAAGIVVPLSALSLAAPPEPPELPEAPPTLEWSWSENESPMPEPAAAPAAPGPAMTGRIPTPAPSPKAAPLATPANPAGVPAAPAPPADPATPTVAAVALAPEPGVSRRVSLHETGDGSGGFFDRPEYRGACDAKWAGNRKFGHRVNVRDDQWKITIDHAGCTLEIEIRGDVRLALLGGGIEHLGRDAEIRIEEETSQGRRLLEATPGPDGSPRLRYLEDGREKPLDASARTWLERTTTEIFRITGLQAEERVEALLRHSGVDGVLEETGRIGSDRIHRTYLEHLFATADLSDRDMERALAQAGEGIGSDFEMAELLVGFAPRLDSTRSQTAYVRAADSIGSDFEARRVVEALTSSHALDAAVLRTILEVAQGIGSDVEMAEALLALARQWPDDRPLDPAFYAALKSVGSDFEARRVLDAVANRNLAAPEWGSFLDAAEGIGSDFEMAELLVTVARRGPGPLPDTFFRALGTVGSDFEAHRVLHTAVLEQDLEQRELIAVLEAARSIGSDHELAELLVTIARRYAVEGPVRDAYLETSRGVASSHDRERVLQAVVSR